jgi:hypothetical protein
MASENDSEPIIYSSDYWRIEVSKLLIQLVQEVHANHGALKIACDLNPIIQLANSTPNAHMLEPTDGE